MATEICQQCGKRMTEALGAYESADLPGVPKHADRFYEQWFVCPNGHKKGYIAGHIHIPGLASDVSQTNVVSMRS